MFRSFVILALLFASVALASGTAMTCACCGTYRVIGVSEGDVLNMRAGPGVRFRKVGSIPSSSGCVIRSRSCKRRWCKVSFAGQKGWVHTGYLKYFAK